MSEQKAEPDASGGSGKSVPGSDDSGTGNSSGNDSANGKSELPAGPDPGSETVLDPWTIPCEDNDLWNFAYGSNMATVGWFDADIMSTDNCCR